MCKVTMDIIGLIDCPVWLLLITGSVITVILYSKWKQGILTRMGISGPRPVLFFGIFPFYNKKGIALADLELVTKYGKVVGVYHGNTPNILISDPDMIEEICVKQFHNFINRSSVMDLGYVLRQSVALSTDTKWKRLRAKLTSAFSNDNLKNTTNHLQWCIENMLEKVKDNSGKCFDISSLCRSYSMDSISRLVFGANINTQRNPDEEIIKMTHKAWVAGNNGAKSKTILCAIFPLMRHIFRLMNYSPLPDYVVRYFSWLTTTGMQERQKLETNHQDLLKFMTSCAVSNGHNTEEELTEEEIMANCIFFILAGYDSTAVALSFVLYCLATNPYCQDKLLKEIDQHFETRSVTYEDVMKLPYLNMVVMETLRLYPPTLRFNRRAESDISIKGQFIQAGMDVSFPVYAIHRNPEFWTEPEKFDPERFSREHTAQNRNTFMPFGCGQRNCFAMNLALFEIKLATVRLLQNFRLQTGHETEIPPTFEKSFYLRPMNGIWLKAMSR